MTASSFNVSILTPDKSILEGAAVSLIAPGEAGYLGILSNHAPLITSLMPGKITVRIASGRTIKIASRGKGFLSVSNNNAVLLLDSVDEENY